MKFFILILTVLIAAGCASTDLTPSLSKELHTPVICKGLKQCNAMWDRAMYFVNSHAGFKVHIANDNMIETYNPTAYSPKLAFKVTKQPLGDESYKIVTAAWCDDWLFGCMPDRLATMAKANRYIRSGVL